MGNALDKIGDDHIFWDQNGAHEKFNNTLTPIQAVNIVNKLSLYCKDEQTLQEAEELKQFIKNR
jgi:hypothetical protein